MVSRTSTRNGLTLLRVVCLFLLVLAHTLEDKPALNKVLYLIPYVIILQTIFFCNDYI